MSYFLVDLAWEALTNKRRGERQVKVLEAFAAQHGLAFSAEPKFDFRDFHFTLLNHEEHLVDLNPTWFGFENELVGSWRGIPVREADHWFKISGPEIRGATTPTWQSIVVTAFPLRVPPITIQSQDIADRVIGLLDRDLKIGSWEFDSKFRIYAEDPDFAAALLDPPMRQWMLNEANGFDFEMVSARVMVGHKLIKPTELASLFDTAVAFRDHIPKAVWERYGAELPS